MRHSPGRVVANASIAAVGPEAMIIGLLDRHVARDWGERDGPITMVLFPANY